MLNIDEKDLKDAIVQKAADAILESDEDLSTLIAKEVKARLDRIFVDRAEAQVSAAIDAAVKDALDREYQRVTSWGEPRGPKTSIRKELEKTMTGYWAQPVESRTGKPTESAYNTITRAEYLMTTICGENFSEAMKKHALNVTGALMDGFRVQLAKQMDAILNDLFHVKSLQDQGKVEKPY